MENDDCLQLLNRAAHDTQIPLLTRQPSQNCADALELRIRINVEIFFQPQSPEQHQLQQQYHDVTTQIRTKVQQNASIGSFCSGLRAKRYHIAQQILSHMPQTGICIGNLSLDYNEAMGSFQLQELHKTTSLLQQFLLQNNPKESSASTFTSTIQ